MKSQLISIRALVAVATAALAVLALLTACSGSDKPRTQSISSSAPVPSISSTAASVTSTSPSSQTSAKPASRTATSRPTPTVTPSAQSAVDAYTAAGNVLLRWDRDPAKAQAAQLSSYVTSTVLSQIIQAYRSMARSGLAYRGVPDQSHIRVIASSDSSAAFTDCPTPAAVDPYTQFVVATGKAVKSTSPGGLHPKAVTVVYQGGHWRISGVVPNLAKTCTA